jgi:hypothetical protein
MESIGWNVGRQKANLVTELNLWNRQKNSFCKFSIDIYAAWAENQACCH